MNLIDEAIALILNRIYKPHAKVLVLDCDNTLWGGIIGEDGLSKIILGSNGIGKAYSDFQISATKLLKVEYYYHFVPKIMREMSGMFLKPSPDGDKKKSNCKC